MKPLGSVLSTAGRHPDASALAALLLCATFVAVVVVRSPSAVGAYEDDGIYLVTSKSLADGRGYRHLELPGEPHQTKYPPAYPLALSLIWRMWPRFPDNVMAFQLLNVILWAGGSWLAYRLLRRALGLPGWLAASSVLLAFLSHGTIRVLETPMAEPLYFLLSMGALSVLPGTGRHVRDARTRASRAVVQGLLAAGACLTRTIGVSLVAALLLEAAGRRAWKQVAVVTGIAGLGVGGWQVWQARAAAANAATSAASLFRYDLDYSAWLPAGVRESVWVFYHNLSDAALSFVLMNLPPPHGWVIGLFRAGSGAVMPLYALMIVMTGLTALGLVTLWRRARERVLAYVAIYMAIVLGWPFEPFRFLVPILPVLNAMLLLGVYQCATAVIGLVRPQVRSKPERGTAHSNALRARRVGATSAGWLTFGIGFVGLVAGAWAAGLRIDDERARRSSAERDELVSAIARSTTPDAVLCTREAGCIYLRTGRKAVPVMPYDDPVAYSYPADRRFGCCGREITPATIRMYRKLFETGFERYLADTGTTHVVSPPQTTVVGLMVAEYRASRRGVLEPVYSGPQSALLRLRLPQ